MMFWMNSKTFQNVFLKNEKDQDILKAQYVLVSMRIRKRKHHDNIVYASALLFPDANVCTAVTDDVFRERYFDQCNSSKAFIATLIKGSIEEKYNIIFMCTKNENKMKYLKYFSDYVYLEFGYPVYDYELYASGALPLRKYKSEKIIKKCNKILKEAKENKKSKDMMTENGRQNIMNEYKKMNKDKLKKKLKKRNLYKKGMSKKDMLEMFETFL